MAEMPGAFMQINNALRNQYSLGYSPTNQAHDGKFRKLTVQLVDASGDPLKIVIDWEGERPAGPGPTPIAEPGSQTPFS